MSIHTAYKIGHYRTGEDGRKSLIWTPGQGEIPLGEVIQGSATDMAVMAEEAWLLNFLVNEGENAILESFFRDNHTPTFYFGLWNEGALSETDTIATLTQEVTVGDGYARIAVVRGTTDWGAAAPDAGDEKTTSATKTFSATGTWTQAQMLGLVSPASGTTGTLYAGVALTTARTLVNGDDLNVSMGVKLS